MACSQETSKVCSSPAGTLGTLNRIEDESRRGTRGGVCISEVTTADCSHSPLFVIMLHLNLQVISDTVTCKIGFVLFRLKKNLSTDYISYFWR
jgi:hypothetical protein